METKVNLGFPARALKYREPPILYKIPKFERYSLARRVETGSESQWEIALRRQSFGREKAKMWRYHNIGMMMQIQKKLKLIFLDDARVEY